MTFPVRSVEEGVLDTEFDVVDSCGIFLAYGKLYGMEKTTVYLPAGLKKSLQRVARATGTSEASLIRQAIEAATRDAQGPRPRLPLFDSGRRDLAERVDELLRGDATVPAFGER